MLYRYLTLATILRQAEFRVCRDIFQPHLGAVSPCGEDGYTDCRSVPFRPCQLSTYPLSCPWNTPGTQHRRVDAPGERTPDAVNFPSELNGLSQMGHGKKKPRAQRQSENLRKAYAKRMRRAKSRNSTDPFRDLSDFLRRYDASQLISTLASLHLLPENHTHIPRLEAAMRVALSLESKGCQRVDVALLGKRLNDYLPAHGEIGLHEDPVDSLFTENLVFQGGNYIVYSGLAEGGAFILEHLLKAVCVVSEGLSAEFIRRVNATATCMLFISDAVAKRAGHVRNLVSPDTWRQNIAVPDSVAASRLTEAVVFSRRAIEHGLGMHGAGPESMVPFIYRGENPLAQMSDLDRNPLYARPLVDLGDQVIVAHPSSITAALRHYILTAAQEAGALDVVMHNYKHVVATTMERALDYLDFSRLDVGLPSVEGTWPVTEYVYRIDSDKLAYVQMIVDDGSDYDENEVFGLWKSGIKQFPMEERRRIVINHLLSIDDLGCRQVLIIAVICAVGRAVVIGFEAPPEGAEELSLFVEELEIVSGLRKYDCLTLWKFAEAKGSFLRTWPRCFGISSFLDILALYLDHRQSFYLSDQGSVIPVISPGYGHRLRIESARIADTHAALRIGDDFQLLYTYVTKRYDESDPIPIYVPRSLASFWRLVEGYRQPIWITRDSVPSVNAGAASHAYFGVLDMLSYWLWQMTPSLRSHLEPLGSDPITIRVMLQDEDKWTWFPEGFGTVPDPHFEIMDCAIRISIPAEIQTLFEKQDNSGERLILWALLRAFNALLGEHSLVSDLDDDECNTILDTHAAIGTKKMISVLQQDRAALNPENLASLRLLHEHDVEKQLDGLARDLKIAPLPDGEILDTETKLNVIDNVVDVYVERLRNALKNLAWEPIVEALIANQESLHHDRVRRMYTIATDIACFSNVPARVESEKERITEISMTALATRTLLEFVVAEPPNGSRVVSTDDLDELVAIAYHIYNWGSFYDQIKLGLFPHRVSILPTGRIGRDIGVIEEFVNTFLHAKVTEGVERSVRKHSRSPAGNAPTESTEATLRDMDVAFSAEFGLSTNETTEFFDCVREMGFAQKRACARLAESIFKEELWARLKDLDGWTDTKLGHAITLYSLTPRTRWDDIPEGFVPADIYPWRYNRRLSYMFRPLVVGVAQGGERTIFWGPRHVEECSIQIFSTVSEGRYPGRSDPMKRFIGASGERMGREFTHEVMEWLQSHSSWLVHDREVPIRTNTQLRAGKDLGDIDVLAVDPQEKVIYSIECKCTNFGRNAREMASELERFLTEEKRNEAWVYKHVERHKWLSQNKSQLSPLFGLDVADFRLQSPIVTSEELPAPYLRNMPLPFVAFTRLQREGVESFHSSGDETTSDTSPEEQA